MQHFHISIHKGQFDGDHAFQGEQHESKEDGDEKGTVDDYFVVRTVQEVGDEHLVRVRGRIIYFETLRAQ